MSGYGLFQPSTLGMQSQTHKLNTIGYNIANVNTGGFKRTDTEFQTLISSPLYEQSDLGGVKPFARATNDVQGLVTPTNRKLDLAITGDGFFAVQPTLTSSRDIFYTRDGSFSINTAAGQTSSVTADDGSTITVSNGYLVDKNGFFVLGSRADANGNFTTGGAQPMRVDQYAFTNQGQPTTTASLEFNLPAASQFGDSTETYALRTYDSNSAQRDINFDFVPMQNTNEWRLNIRGDNLTSFTTSPSTTPSIAAGLSGPTGRAFDSQFVFDAANRTIQLVNVGTGNPVDNAFSQFVAGDQISLTGTTSNNATFTIDNVTNNGSTIVLSTAPTAESTGVLNPTLAAANALTSPLTFNSLGQLQSPTSVTLNATWSDGATSAITVDISNMSQFHGDFTVFRTDQNGLGLADLTDVSFDGAGHVVGLFSDGSSRNVYKIPLYDFTNPNALSTDNGMIFKETTESGSASAFFADLSSKADFQNSAVEISNVDVAAEFAKMIQTQNAYNMSATSFKTIDEMTTVARDLKA